MIDLTKGRGAYDLYRAWAAETHESSAEDRGTSGVGPQIHQKVPRSSVDARKRDHPPVPAVVMSEPEALVRSPQVRRRYILKQDVARYGPTPGCEACAPPRSTQSDEATRG